MLKHIVMWKLKENALGNTKEHNMQIMKERLLNCKNIVEGILCFEVALSSADLECTYDVILYSEFVDKQALDAYQNHPLHAAIKPFIMDIRLERQCMDYYG